MILMFVSGCRRTRWPRFDERTIPKDFALKTEWPWIKAIGETIRYTVNGYDRETHDVRYDMLSRPQDRSEA